MDHRRYQLWRSISLSLLTLFLIWVIGGSSVAYSNFETMAMSPQIPAIAPTARPHPLPLPLDRWRDRDNAGDYFDQIQPVSVGYLVWSRFPVTVYVEPLKSGEQPDSFSGTRSQVWINAVTTAVQEWNQYLPLKLVSQPETADIQVWRSAPPLQLERRSDSFPRLGRVRAAETRFHLSTSSTSSTLAHRFTILLRPDQAPLYTLATARHELGHAIGLWGHSQQPTDALYFAQVRQPPSISARDVNTLKRIYEQPTQLGWMPQ